MAGATSIDAVTFGIGAEVFAAPVSLVREILDYQTPFRLPNAPAHFVGLIDARGVGIPTIDLRLRLGMAPAEPTLATRILIVEVERDDGPPLQLGLVIDRALVVATFTPEQIEQSPEIGVRWRSEYITGVVRQNGGFVVLIDVARILTSSDIALIADAATPEAA